MWPKLWLSQELWHGKHCSAFPTAPQMMFFLVLNSLFPRSLALDSQNYGNSLLPSEGWPFLCKNKYVVKFYFFYKEGEIPLSYPVLFFLGRQPAQSVVSPVWEASKSCQRSVCQVKKKKKICQVKQSLPEGQEKLF